MTNIKNAINEVDAIVNGMKEQYTKEELSVSIIRLDHSELKFMDNEEIQTLIDFANLGR